MSRSLAGSVRSARTAFWHFRKGGLRQVRSWRSRRINRPGRELSGQALRRALIRKGSFTAEDVPEWPVAERAPRRPDLRVGVIMDTFSARAWGYEFDVLELTSDGWREQLVEQSIDLLFVESAWAGSNGSWRYQLTGSKAPTTSLRDLVEHCRSQQVPTVFWNKEDPPHFADFLDTARLFDRVFTTDANLLERYRQDLGHDRVEVLGFAAQPVLHHPMRHKEVYQARDIAFGGSYWSHKFPERQAQMDLLLGAAMEVATQRDQLFDIYSRFDHDAKYRFPERFDGSVRGSLDYDRMLTAYRLHKVMLNVNSVVDSPTMMARRVFEILASGTPVVSTRSPAVEHWFPAGEVAIVDDADEAALTLRALLGSPELRDRMVHRAQRRIWRDHTFSARAGQVLGAVGITDPVGTAAPTVSVIAPTIRPHLMRGIVETAARQRDVDVQLLLLAHGFAPPAAELTALAKDLGLADVVVLEADAATSLGVNLNTLVDASDADFVAKLDDDDLYGDHYLADAVHALDYSGADLVGKHARFTYLADVDATVLQYPQREHRWTDLVGGPTMVGPRQTFAACPFEDRTLGEDTTFQRALTAAGGTIYGADRFNFIQMRGASGGHTWTTQDEQILANGRVQAFGLVTDHVMV